MVRCSMTDGPHLYVNLLDFKDKEEQTKYFKRIQQMIKEDQGRTKIYGLAKKISFKGTIGVEE